jgi:hypothetical protein
MDDIDLLLRTLFGLILGVYGLRGIYLKKIGFGLGAGRGGARPVVSLKLMGGSAVAFGLMVLCGGVTLSIPFLYQLATGKRMDENVGSLFLIIPMLIIVVGSFVVGITEAFIDLLDTLSKRHNRNNLDENSSQDK